MKSLYLLWAIVFLDVIDSPISSCSCNRDSEYLPSSEQTQTEQPQEMENVNSEAFAVTE